MNLKKWCLSTLPLEPFLKDILPCQRLEVTGIEPREGIPTPIPATGIPLDSRSPFVYGDFIDFSPSLDPPDFGRFYGSRCCALRAWCSPKTSLIAHAKHGFTDGTCLTIKDIIVLLNHKRVATGKTVLGTRYRGSAKDL